MCGFGVVDRIFDSGATRCGDSLLSYLSAQPFLPIFLFRFYKMTVRTPNSFFLMLASSLPPATCVSYVVLISFHTGEVLLAPGCVAGGLYSVHLYFFMKCDMFAMVYLCIYIYFGRFFSQAPPSSELAMPVVCFIVGL